MGTRTYTASEQVYISSEGRMVYPGETFTVSDEVKPGKTWLDEKGEPLSDDDGKKGGSRPRANQADA